MPQILIAEDHPDQRLRMTRIFRQYEDRFTVRPVCNGKEAIDALKSEAIDLVVTDIQMPEIDGILLLAYIHTYHPQIPCFVTTAYGTSRLQAKLPEDILRFFHKPFDVHDLARAIIAALEERSESRQQGIALVKFLHMIAMEEGTCQMEVKTQNQETGTLYFENGVLIHADKGNLSGEAAALGILSEQQGQYRIHPFQQGHVPRSVKTDLSELIRNVYGTPDPAEEEKNCPCPPDTD